MHIPNRAQLVFGIWDKMRLCKHNRTCPDFDKPGTGRCVHGVCETETEEEK